MSSLPEFPDELLVQIFKYLLPDDIDSVSNSCKDFHAISVRIVPDHKQLKKKYTTIHCGLFGHQTLHPLCMFRDLFQDPNVIWYVKNMYIQHCQDDYAREGESWDEARSIAVQFKDKIIRVVHACPYVEDEERERWTSLILSCNQNIAVAILASMLPCLEGLDVKDNKWSDELCELGRNICEESIFDPRGSHALNKLVWVKEELHKSATLYTAVGMLEPFATLPSMRYYGGRHLYDGGELLALNTLTSLELHSMGSWDPMSFNWSSAGRISNISTLEFKECSLRDKTLQGLFEGIANLRDFTYECDWTWRAPRSAGYHHRREKHWRPKKIIESLIVYAGHSLVSLNLTRIGGEEIHGAEEEFMDPRKHDDDEFEKFIMKEVMPFMGSLRGFQVLKYIRVPNEVFVDEDAKDSPTGRMVHPLVDRLPASVRRLALAMPQLCEQESYQLAEGLVEHKAERVPKLEVVIFETGKGRKDMKVESVIAGVKFVR